MTGLARMRRALACALLRDGGRPTRRRPRDAPPGSTTGSGPAPGGGGGTPVTNAPATGAPPISGTPEVGQTLTAPHLHFDVEVAGDHRVGGAARPEQVLGIDLGLQF